jgi:phospholipid-translocating P-type ATPase (flippase)
MNYGATTSISLKGAFPRHVEVEWPQRMKRGKHCDNAVSSTKYTVFNFLPNSIYEQFSRVANFYFLVIILMMIIGSYTALWDSPLSPWSTIVVLTLVVSISIIKGGAEDSKRASADAEMNRRTVKIINRFDVDSELYQEIEWRDVEVGDIVYLENKHELPADILLLTSADAHGTAYVETSNIDGEANLKAKYSPPTGENGLPTWKSAAEMRKESFEVRCDDPNPVIQRFDGVLLTGGKEVPVGMTNLLLRGSSLRNTQWALGVVLYTGKETKLVMNARQVPTKISMIETTMNTFIIVVLCMQVALSLASQITYIVWKLYNFSSLQYVCFDSEISTNALLRDNCVDSEDDFQDWGYFFTYFILYSNLLPISMYVTVEICNYYQGYFIEKDLEMYHEPTDTPATARNSNLNADLGMIEYIFSDKTGTLTENVMNFKRFSVAGVVYGNSISDGNKYLVKKRAVLDGQDLSIVASQSGLKASPLRDFVVMMAVCHTVVIEPGTGVLQSESPDEEALVKAAKDLGYAFVERTKGKVTLRREDPSFGSDHGKEFTYEILATIPFDSTRKRMSVVVRGPDRIIWLYTKGADNVLFDMAAAFLSGNNDKTEKVEPGKKTSSQTLLEHHLEVFATDGLRTLVFGKRRMRESEAKQFLKAWAEAEKSTAQKEQMLTAAAAIIEKNLVIVGATAIEDKLQEGVPQTIKDLANAGIRLWVLTGDKLETAINIGYSSGLLDSEVMLMRLEDKGEDTSKFRKKLKRLVSHFDKMAADGETMRRALDQMKDNIDTILHGKKRDEKIIESMEERDPNLQAPMGAFSFSTNEKSAGSASTGSSFDLEKIFEASPLLQKSESRPRTEQLTSEHLALIIDGESLIKAFSDEESERYLLTLCVICKAVIACRVSPAQKSQLVRMVKKGLKPSPMTLAIGDGANDVAMIQEAQVGVGISGKEGKQAVNSADFAIAQFRYLKKLLLVHGRYDYRRICKVILYSFYKNVVMTGTLFAFTFYSGFSAQSLYDSNIHSAYNLILGFPVIATGIFDRDVSVELLKKYNIMYVAGREKLDLNMSTCLWEFFQACVDSMLIFYVPYACYLEARDVWTEQGYNSGLWIFSTTIYSCLVLAMFLRVIMITNTWTVYTHLFLYISVVSYIIFLIVYQYLVTIAWDYYGVTTEMGSQPMFWWLLLVVPAISGMVELTVRITKREFLPTVTDVGCEIDSGESQFSNLFPLIEIQPAPGPPPAPSAVDSEAPLLSEEKSEAELAAEQKAISAMAQEASLLNAEAELRFSPMLTGGRKRYPLDWEAIRTMYASMLPAESADLGLQSLEEAPPTSTFNFDHVNSSSAGFGLFGSQTLVQLSEASMFVDTEEGDEEGDEDEVGGGESKS